MLWNAPCPKCREPVLIGANQCGNCKYRLMRHEVRRAVWRFGTRMSVGVVAVAAIVFAITQS